MPFGLHQIIQDVRPGLSPEHQAGFVKFLEQKGLQASALVPMEGNHPIAPSTRDTIVHFLKEYEVAQTTAQQDITLARYGLDSPAISPQAKTLAKTLLQERILSETDMHLLSVLDETKLLNIEPSTEGSTEISADAKRQLDDAETLFAKLSLDVEGAIVHNDDLECKLIQTLLVRTISESTKAGKGGSGPHYDDLLRLFARLMPNAGESAKEMMRDFIANRSIEIDNGLINITIRAFPTPAEAPQVTSDTELTELSTYTPYIGSLLAKETATYQALLPTHIEKLQTSIEADFSPDTLKELAQTTTPTAVSPHTFFIKGLRMLAQEFHATQDSLEYYASDSHEATILEAYLKTIAKSLLNLLKDTLRTADFSEEGALANGIVDTFKAIITPVNANQLKSMLQEIQAEEYAVLRDPGNPPSSRDLEEARLIDQLLGRPESRTGGAFLRSLREERAPRTPPPPHFYPGFDEGGVAFYGEERYPFLPLPPHSADPPYLE